MKSFLYICYICTLGSTFRQWYSYGLTIYMCVCVCVCAKSGAGCTKRTEFRRLSCSQSGHSLENYKSAADWLQENLRCFVNYEKIYDIFRCIRETIRYFSQFMRKSTVCRKLRENRRYFSLHTKKRYAIFRKLRENLQHFVSSQKIYDILLILRIRWGPRPHQQKACTSAAAASGHGSIVAVRGRNKMKGNCKSHFP